MRQRVMNVRSATMVSVIGLALVGGLAWANNSFKPFAASTTDPAPAITPDASDELLVKIAKYKTWTRVNPQPVKMDLQSAQACASVASAMARGPHRDKYVTVFVNADGTPAMMEQKNPKFPVGSIVVKEKLKDLRGGEPELLTAMVKREAGYYPAGGDWEYLVLDGAASSITQRGKLDSCNACHSGYQDDDYLFRSYLPGKVRAGLK